MSNSIVTKGRSRPMNIFVRRGSRAQDKYRALGGVPGLGTNGTAAPTACPTASISSSSPLMRRLRTREHRAVK